MTKEAKLGEYLLRLKIYTSTKYIQKRIEKEVSQKSQATGKIIEFTFLFQMARAWNKLLAISILCRMETVVFELLLSLLLVTKSNTSY